MTETRNAIIEQATITLERGFALDAWLHLDYGGEGQGFGGYALGGTKGTMPGDHTGPNYAAEFIVNCLLVAGVDDWSRLSGKAIRAKIDDGYVSAIGHITKDIWFCPKEAFAALERK